jgi:hypothetical protein
MRFVRLITIAWIVLAGSSIVGGQTGPIAPEIIERLQSSTPAQRQRGFLNLTGRRDLLLSSAGLAALADLLVRETSEIETVLQQSEGRIGISQKYGEAYSEYYSEVLGALDKVGDKRDPYVLRALARASYNATSPFAINLAKEFGAEISETMLNLASDRSSSRRMQGLEMLATINANARRLPDATKKANHAVILAGLNDKDTAIRQICVEGLGRSGDKNDLSLLEEIASHDPGLTEFNGIGRYFVREAATKAMVAIRIRSR